MTNKIIYLIKRNGRKIRLVNVLDDNKEVCGYKYCFSDSVWT